MKTIYKYQIEIQDKFTLEMPKHAKILTVQTQFGTPCIWAKIDPDEPIVKRKFLLLGTGHDASKVYEELYIGTFQMHSFVFHLFETLGD